MRKPDPVTTVETADEEGGLTPSEFDAFFRHNQHRLRTHAFRISGDSDLAQDIVQEAFVTALERIIILRKKGLISWFYRVITNLCIDEIVRKKRIAQAVDIDDLSEPPVLRGGWSERLTIDTGILTVLQNRQALLNILELTLSRHIIRALEEGSPELVHTFLLDYLGYKYAEIAGILKIPQGTVMSRIHRARKLLRGTLGAAAAEGYGFGDSQVA